MLTTPIAALSRVGEKTSSKLKKLGIYNIEDLALFFPFRYEDYSHIKNIVDIVDDSPVTIKAKVQLIANRRSFRTRKNITEAMVADETESLKVIWFNQPFLIKTLKVGDEVYLSGKIDITRMQMVSPDYEKVSFGNSIHTARLVPVYHLTGGVTQKQIRFLLNQINPAFSLFDDFLPEYLRSKYGFPELSQALFDIHFPQDLKTAETAKNRLKFEELLLIQLAILLSKVEIDNNRALKVSFIEKATKDYVTNLPFELTADQKKASWEIIQDLGKEKIMNRLLEGDVGSGKTIVVSLAILNVILNGYKVALMAPTEILAVQHYQTFVNLFKNKNFSIALLTGNKREVNGKKISKKELLDRLSLGKIDLTVGTHAVIQDNVKIKDLALVVVDEQHRFGVKQRKALVQRDKQDLVPHFLSMTATPIPRSLVLALYGDLDLSIIKQMPKGRKPIITKVVFEDERERAYQFIRDQIERGRQVFVICPLIDPSDKLGVKSVKQEYEKLDKDIFPDLSIGLMHGRLKASEKEVVMSKFYNKEYSILVSTSVIEVGIDVPNASIMIIEGSDRFGLAQLHQFRGRVGRGEHQSYCFLFSDNNNEQTQKRLKYLEECRDGFALAERDLELRGPGEVYGIKQSGMPDLKIATLSDTDLIRDSQIEARNLIENNGLTEDIKNMVKKIRISLHFE